MIKADLGGQKLLVTLFFTQNGKCHTLVLAKLVYHVESYEALQSKSSPDLLLNRVIEKFRLCKC